MMQTRRSLELVRYSEGAMRLVFPKTRKIAMLRNIKRILGIIESKTYCTVLGGTSSGKSSYINAWSILYKAANQHSKIEYELGKKLLGRWNAKLNCEDETSVVEMGSSVQWLYTRAEKAVDVTKQSRLLKVNRELKHTIVQAFKNALNSIIQKKRWFESICAVLFVRLESIVPVNSVCCMFYRQGWIVLSNRSKLHYSTPFGIWNSNLNPKVSLQLNMEGMEKVIKQSMNGLTDMTEICHWSGTKIFSAA